MKNNAKKMNPETQKYLKAGGILCAIGAVSALLITGVNVLTSPLIAAQKASKQLAAYQAIYSSVKAVSDPVSVSGSTYVKQYWTAFSDEGKTAELGKIYDAIGSNGHVSGMEIMVGVSGSVDAPVYGKISVITNGTTGGDYSTNFLKYVDSYNSDPNSTALANVKCGATQAATVTKAMVDEAVGLYQSGGQAGTSIDTVLQSLYDSKALARTESQDVSGTYLSKYWIAYSDAHSVDELGYVYKLKGSATDSDGTSNASMTAYVAFAGFDNAVTYGKIYVDANSFAASTAFDSYVSAYNASPSATTLAATPSADGKEAGTLLKAMVDEAKAAYTSERQAIKAKSKQIFDAYAAAGDSSLPSGAKMVKEAWAAYSDALKSSELGYVFLARAYLETEAEYNPIETSVTLLMGVSGDSANPTYGKIYVVAESVGTPAGFDKTAGVYVTTYNANPSSATLDEVSCGSTYTANLMRDMIKEARTLYTSLKGGN